MTTTRRALTGTAVQNGILECARTLGYYAFHDPNSQRTEPGYPDITILYRSAAWMAVHAGEPDEALRLAREGIAGFPPPSVAAELDDVIAFVEHGTVPA